MDLTQLANLGEFIGGIAVLVTLVYLAVQMRDTRRQLDEQSVATGAASAMSAFDPVCQARNAAVFRKGIQGEPLGDPDEEFVFRLLMYRQATAVGMLSRTESAVGDQIVSGLNDLVFAQPGASEWLGSIPEGPFKDSVLKALQEAQKAVGDEPLPAIRSLPGGTLIDIMELGAIGELGTSSDAEVGSNRIVTRVISWVCLIYLGRPARLR